MIEHSYSNYAVIKYVYKNLSDVGKCSSYNTVENKNKSKIMNLSTNLTM